MKELITIQSELKAPKNHKTTYYNYRSAEDILEAVKKILPKVGCILTISDTIEQVGNRIYVKATARLVNSEGQCIETSAYAREEESNKNMSVAQLTGSTSSYARKYALNGLFCIDDTEDPDATTAREREKNEVKEAPQQLSVSGMVLDIMSSMTEDELRKKWTAYQKYDDAEGSIKKAKDIRKMELGL